MPAGEQFEMADNPSLNIEGDYSEVKELNAEIERLQGENERITMERDGFDAIAQHSEAEVERLTAENRQLS